MATTSPATTAGTVSAESYERVALRDPEGNWELLDGVLREKPGMTFDHNDVAVTLGVFLYNALDRTKHLVRINFGRTRISSETYYIPDVMVVPRALSVDIEGRPDVLEVYADPLPFVAEVWSPSTGGYDVGVKLAGHQQRGDAEIWYIQPYDKTLTVWRRRPDGSYDESSPAIGQIAVASLPGVVIDLAALLDRA